MEKTKRETKLGLLDKLKIWVIRTILPIYIKENGKLSEDGRRKYISYKRKDGGVVEISVPV